MPMPCDVLSIRSLDFLTLLLPFDPKLLVDVSSFMPFFDNFFFKVVPPVVVTVGDESAPGLLLLSFPGGVLDLSAFNFIYVVLVTFSLFSIVVAGAAAADDKGVAAAASKTASPPGGSCGCCGCC